MYFYIFPTWFVSNGRPILQVGLLWSQNKLLATLTEWNFQLPAAFFTNEKLGTDPFPKQKKPTACFDLRPNPPPGIWNLEVPPVQKAKFGVPNSRNPCPMSNESKWSSEKKTTPLKSNIDTQNSHVWKEIHLKPIILDIYVRFRGCSKSLSFFLCVFFFFRKDSSFDHPPASLMKFCVHQDSKRR